MNSKSIPDMLPHTQSASPAGYTAPHRFRASLGWFGRGVAMALLFVVIVLPLLWILSAAFKHYVDIYKLRVTFTPTIGNFFEIMREPFRVQDKLINSIIVSMSTVVITLPIATAAAYSFSRFRLFAHKSMLVAVLATQFLPPVVIVLPFFLMFRDLGLYDTRLALIVVQTALVMPFAIWMIKGFIDQIPIDIEESALIDGATRLQVLYQMIMPIALPGIVTAGIFCFILSWNDFIIAVILTSEDAVTLPVAMSLFNREEGDLWQLLSATGILIMLPMFLFASFMQRYLIRGTTAGAVR
ncbi:MAG: carbohydrate ABC transporter permease [Pseudomonadota bacterium]|jgi:multiple sugar transport system permease protein|uniref:ABC-type sugar transport system, permease component n=1 Tax=Caballeronia sordidicola TaxID=196367 RepID=A0A242N5E8_CABSO|nr:MULTISPECIES: carbohydrate ABC transporter permease [Burkholderiaceae]MDP9152933.1 carbohydrate ABC transporter permease [Pseudomonadota bacterium]OTP78376.1 ABC-type sugar transport system, permease component [Caballeronia sordidicola]OTP80399.1 ABC-type sugar transport system, permease component [Caballeronia sordidicola]